MTALTQKASADASRDISILTVDYRLTLAEMIAAGRYDWTSDEITAERFALAGDGVVECEAKPFHFDKIISSEDAREAMEADGWQPDKVEHLLTFGATHPDEQRKLPIVALGSSTLVDDCRRVPCLLDRSGSERNLCLVWWSVVFGARCRFLAVRNLSSAT